MGRNYFFGSELVYPNLDYSDTLTNKHLARYDIESIFGFDVLIRNTDRREKKPNIFFQKDTYYLIDHEQTLYIDKGFIDYYNTSNRWSFIYKDIKGKGFDTSDYAAIRSYLEEIKLNQSKFIALLHELIQ